MSDYKYSQLQFAKLSAEVKQDGMSMTDGPNHSHTIFGPVEGTESLDANHGIGVGLDAFNGRDFFDFTAYGGHNFNLTISGFNPVLGTTGNLPTSPGQALTDPSHDVFLLTFDPSTGITSDAQAAAAFVPWPDGHFGDIIGHDVVYKVHTANLDGQITFAGAGDLLAAHPGLHFDIYAAATHTTVG